MTAARRLLIVKGDRINQAWAMLLVGALALVAVGCSGVDEGQGIVAAGSVSTTSMVTTTVPVTTTTVDAPTLEDWVPVGGSEFHDSQSSYFSDDAGGSSEALDHASARLRDFVEWIDAEQRKGELHLGAIDMFWGMGLAMLEEPDDVALVRQQMERLATARDAALKNLPDALREHEEILSAALIERDLESRVAAYDLLDDLVRGDTESWSEASNMVLALHWSLGEDVLPEVIRRDALGSGRIGPELDPEDLPALPDQVLLVQWTDGLYPGDLVVVLGVDGTPIGYLDDHTLGGPRAMTIAGGQVLYGALDYGPSNDMVEGCVASWAAADRTYLICDDTTSYDDPAWRAEIQVRYNDGSTERLGGAGYVYPDAPGDPVAGHWRYVIPSPDGGAVLGQWSGECESPSAHMIYRGAVSTGMGNINDAWPESHALGWRDDGAALVSISAGACSFAYAESGVYAVVPGGDPVPLYLTDTGGATVRLIDPYAPVDISLNVIVASDAPDPRVYFDDFAMEVIDIAGGIAASGLIGGLPVVTFLCDDGYVTVGPARVDDYDALVVRATGFAEQHGCRPMLAGPYECLGIASDPIACSE